MRKLTEEEIRKSTQTAMALEIRDQLKLDEAIEKISPPAWDLLLKTVDLES